MVSSLPERRSMKLLIAETRVAISAGASTSRGSSILGGRLSSAASMVASGRKASLIATIMPASAAAHDADQHHGLDGEIAGERVARFERLADHGHDPAIGLREVTPDRRDPDWITLERRIADKWSAATCFRALRQRHIVIARDIAAADGRYAIENPRAARDRQRLEGGDRHLRLDHAILGRERLADLACRAIEDPVIGIIGGGARIVGG